MKKRIVALLTGRGGSSLKDKNILEILKQPVLCYPAKAAKNSKYIDDYYVSSDDEKILTTAGNEGYKLIKRPVELAQPDTQHMDVILHSLDELKKKGENPDILIVLLANNVTIKTEWIDDCIEMMMQDSTITAVVPMYEYNDHHPLRCKKVDENGNVVSFTENKGKDVSTNRQDLEKCYFLSHNFWVLNVNESILKNDGECPWKFMGKKVKGYEVDCAIDIHEKEDLILAEEWIKQNL